MRSDRFKSVGQDLQDKNTLVMLVVVIFPSTEVSLLKYKTNLIHVNWLSESCTLSSWYQLKFNLNESSYYLCEAFCVSLDVLE